MGNTSSSPVQKCLEGALGGQKNLVAFKSNPLYQIAHVKPYNLGISVTPAAVTYPKTAEHISAIVKCAVDNSLKVQPRCGGHSYANYGEWYTLIQSGSWSTLGSVTEALKKARCSKAVQALLMVFRCECLLINLQELVAKTTLSS